MAQIFVVGGGKGGVGKSTISLSLYYAFKNDVNRIRLFECDKTNPDVARALPNAGVSLMNHANLREWETVLIEAKNADIVIVNLPGGGEKEFLRYSSPLADSAIADGHELIYFCVMNTSKECVLLLRDTISQLASNVALVAVLNEKFGEQNEYTRYNSSVHRESLFSRTGKGGSELVIPKMQDFTHDALIENTLDKQSTFSQILFRDYLAAVKERLAAL